MPLYMDVHNMDGGVSCDAVRDAHAKDVAIQGDHGVNYKSYWVSESEGSRGRPWRFPGPASAT